MADALLVPVLALLFVGLITAVFAVGKVRRARRADETLPDEPGARRQEEARRLRQEHVEASPSLTRHPSRRP